MRSVARAAEFVACVLSPLEVALVLHSLKVRLGRSECVVGGKTTINKRLEKSYLESGRQRIVLNGQPDLVARPQQLHHRFLVRGARHVRAVHLEDAVAHAQLAGQGRDATGDDLEVGGENCVNCSTR